jgi:hypothetical protein
MDLEGGVVAYPYAQEPAPRSRPTTVTISSYLLYLVAAVELIGAVIGLSVVGTMSRIIDDDPSLGALSSSARTFVVGSVVFGASVEVLFAAGLTILAIFNGRGRQGSRITTWVIGGLALCCNGFGVLGSRARFTTNFDPGNGRSSTDDLERRLNDELPSWYNAATVTLAVISLLALLAVIILLALPASNAYFRRVVTGGWDPSLQYGGATPYGAQSPYPYSPQQPPYPGQQPPYPGQPYPGQPVYPGQPYPGQPPQPPQPPPPGAPEQATSPHTGSVEPTDPWSPPSNGDRPPSDPTSQY